MKAVTVFLFVLIAAVIKSSSAMTTDELKTAIMGLMKQCEAETNVPADVMAKIKNHEVVDSREGNCFKACILRNMGVITADNKIIKDKVLDNVRTLLNPDEEKMTQFANLIDECNQYSEADECDAAKKMCECYSKQPDSNLFIKLL